MLFRTTLVRQPIRESKPRVIAEYASEPPGASAGSRTCEVSLQRCPFSPHIQVAPNWMAHMGSESLSNQNQLRPKHGVHGWHALEEEDSAPNSQLKQDRNIRGHPARWRTKYGSQFVMNVQRVHTEEPLRSGIHKQQMNGRQGRDSLAHKLGSGSIR